VKRPARGAFASLTPVAIATLMTLASPCDAASDDAADSSLTSWKSTRRRVYVVSGELGYLAVRPEPGGLRDGRGTLAVGMQAGYEVNPHLAIELGLAGGAASYDAPDSPTAGVDYDRRLELGVTDFGVGLRGFASVGRGDLFASASVGIVEADVTLQTTTTEYILFIPVYHHDRIVDRTSRVAPDLAVGYDLPLGRQRRWFAGIVARQLFPVAGFALVGARNVNVGARAYSLRLGLRSKSAWAWN
jgi:hypothetical protein